MSAGSQFHRGYNYVDDPLVAGVLQRNISSINSAVTTWAELAAIPTVGAIVPAIIIWNDADGITHATRLMPGTDATNTANGIQQPDDFNASTNAVVWYDQAL